jgi:hypothetical protein
MKNGIKSLTMSKHYLGLDWPSSGSSTPVTFLHCAVLCSSSGSTHNQLAESKSRQSQYF